jgi:hypothetical protein
MVNEVFTPATPEHSPAPEAKLWAADVSPATKFTGMGAHAGKEAVPQSGEEASPRTKTPFRWISTNPAPVKMGV